MHYVFVNSDEVFEPFYQTKIKTFPWERELLKSKTLNRLKHLSHYGTGSLISSAKHSRFEHTIGVWATIATFFPKEEELRIAAFLHDIGHLPFSHAVEKTLGFNHHTITEQKISGGEIAEILLNHGFSPSRIIDLLNSDSPLTHKTTYLGADHLDSFLRDAYMLGKSDLNPPDILQRISFNGHYVEADLQIGRQILEAIYYDHQSFLSPTLLALDGMLAQAISIYSNSSMVKAGTIQDLTNYELISLLQNSGIKEVVDMLDVILYHPEEIVIKEVDFSGAVKVEVRKVYDKTPLVDGKPLTSICENSQMIMDRIYGLQKNYYVSINPIVTQTEK
ncbi:hypothetical protein GCM10008967_38350 [Bacillus carboniphilus]|uniref:HD domain-containing protein n=1 Tax=Bacillus carboniphilus TaxID=86663 RepID=A0ABN0WQM8_9BACI